MESGAIPLRGLHLPDATGWWPLAPGWWVLIVLAALLLGWLLRRRWQRWKFESAQRYALRRLASIESAYLEHRNPVQLGKDVSELLRRSMLAYAPRAEMAGLTGEAWLRWLDRDLPVPYFHTEGGKSLLELPYRNPESDIGDIDINALLAAAKMRLSTPPGVPG